MPVVDFCTVEIACQDIGGKDSPISPATFYRGVKRGLYPRPIHVSPGVVRVDRSALRAKIAAMLPAVEVA